MATIDPSQLGQWFDACGATLTLYARQCLPAPAAEDVVQDVFVRLMAQRQPPRNVKAWLFRSVRNAAVSRIRAERSRLNHEPQAAAQRARWFEHRHDDLIDADVAQQTLASLPHEQREVVVLRIWADMTLQEIADVTGEPVSTLFSRYKAGLAEVRRRLESSCKTKNH
ncbi:MAG: sigma-70 family RNA polymerase sigma factor [Phycisphaerae bacterium]|nr:sigma-70 family RNA polymerase sigma factor [Phycisphaerae bacterium]